MAMANVKINDRVLWHDPWREDWGVPMDTREWTVFDVREDMVCICTGTFGSSGYAEAEVPPQELELIRVARLKATAVKVARVVARVVWFVAYFVIAIGTMYMVALVLDYLHIGNALVRFIIGLPCILVIPTGAGLLYLTITKRYWANEFKI